MLWITKTFQKPIHQSNINLTKKRSRGKFTAYFYDLTRAKISSVKDYPIESEGHAITVRLYHFQPGISLPIILYFHGGGFVLGGIEAYDHFCRKLSKLTQCAVVSVDYRLAPEFKFPAAHNDALVSLDWVLSNGLALGLDTTSLFLAGDSSGGNLAASLAFQARERKIPIRGQVLIYPVLDFSAPKNRYYDQFLLGEEGSKWFARNFLDSDQNRADPRLSLKFNQDFTHLPDALIIQAEYDHLNEEIEEFQDRMINAGNTSILVKIHNTFHGFITMMNWTSKAKESLHRISQFIGGLES